ncbi:MAG: AMP-binding protein, partial [Bacillota bacterium]|nr:AMP-binding protein [Bacillota bacterium]
MNEILKKYCDRIDFESYEDFKKNYTVNVPEDFNFGFDVVDTHADASPNKLALRWTNDAGDMKEFTFADIKKNSNKAANFFKSKGIKKGDVVMLILKQRPEVWFSIVALCKMGAICIPASYQLTPKDIVYRCNVASVKMLVAVDDDEIIKHITDSLPKCETLKDVAIVGEEIPNGFIDFKEEILKQSDVFERPMGEDALKASDNMLIYFSSGTTGMPKMVLQNNTLPLGHIVTAKYWQCVQDDKVHMTQTDSGWAKFAWGKIYGQWICGAAIGAYDTEKFDPHAMLEAIIRLKPTTFCAPATIYRMLIKEDLSKYNLSFIEHASLAGEPLNPEVFKKIQELLGLTIYEGFGQTESSVLLANFKWMDIKPGSMGKP